ncbi:hypothetical protein [Saccharothrix xinjiangensis]|uniref:Uncharacterized protein n=1 Tax=Saccharothrix xinjiangensis TaxID=204798 RepID=A0ABV9XW02_9PSEU
MPASEEVQTEVAERRARAVQLRIAGASLDEIAAALNYGGSSTESRRAAVSKDLKRAWEAAREAQAASAVELRELELARLDRIQRGVWPMAVAGDTKAVRAVLGVMDRRARLLGLDAPTRLEGPLDAPVPVEFMGLVEAARTRAQAERLALEAAPPPEGE